MSNKKKETKNNNNDNDNDNDNDNESITYTSVTPSALNIIKRLKSLGVEFK